MKNKKVMITMIIAVVVLTIIAVTGGIIKISHSNIVKVAKNQNEVQLGENNDESQNTNENIENEEKTEENNNETTQEEKVTIQEARTAAAESNAVSSRSEVNRESVTSNSTTKIEDIQISFNMDVSKTTGLSKEDFVYLVENMKYDKTGILAKNAAWIWECCQKYSVNEIFVLGICGIESGWCSAPQHQNTHNYSSLMKGGKLIPYSSDEEGFEAMIKLLGERYLTPGGSFYNGATITGVGKCYCNPTSWPQKVYTCMQQALK